MELRDISLLVVLESLGFSNFKSRKGGNEFYGSCPVHKGKNPTCFSFHQDGRFRCFSCNLKGKGSIDLVKAVKGCGYQEAVTYLGTVSQSNKLVPTGSPARASTTKQGETIPRGKAEAAEQNPEYKASYEKYKVKSEWLERRGFTQETLDHFGVFQYENPARRSQYSGHIFFPIKRIDGVLVGYLTRNRNPTGDAPKYLWPKGVSKGLELFGSYQLAHHRTSQSLPLRVLYIVESPLCVMKFHQLGFPAVSPFGWSVSPQQVQLLKGLTRGAVYLPDANVRTDALRSVLPLLASSCWVKCPEYRTDDPEKLSKEQIQELTR